MAVDFGNTTLKAALFENEELLEVRYSLSTTALKSWIKEIEKDATRFLKGIMISSVRKNEEVEFAFVEELQADLSSSSKLIIKSTSDKERVATKDKQISVVVLDENTPLPIRNEYKTPKTLGKDRLAAVIGAYFLNEEFAYKPTLVIDAGTCITYDFINLVQNEGIYEGGSISLGLQMRFKALNHFTANLPLFEPQETLPTPVGKTTEGAMQSGVQFGLMAEIKGIIDFYQKSGKEELNIVVCGGDAKLLKKWWREYTLRFTNDMYSYKEWTIEPNLVLIGLQRIFQFIKNNEDN
ncbi:type III pantothenate kinase [Bernardetia sp.]|uniref:type III pantothenate kinase n=1 Tax=Bernardetia sp. TaxID=1937974 RepID=UPI0025B98972|nr:type III pantothenate kinase [Bernardetia sp.]